MTQSTSVVATAVKALVADPRRSIADVLHGLKDATATVGDIPKKLTGSPAKTIVPSMQQTIALAQAADAVADFRWITEGREMEPAELRKLIQLFDVVTHAQELIEAAKANIRRQAFCHFDAIAVREGRATDETPRHSKEGYFLLEDVTNGEVDGLDTKITREVRRGALEDVSGALAVADAAGEIEHKDYLDATQAVRVVDESGFRKVLARSTPFAEAVRALIKSKAPSISMYGRKND